jgi:CBS domain-containing protein
MVKLKDIMTRNLVKIKSDKNVSEACHLMAKMNIGSLIICKEEEIVGILVEADIIRNALAKDLDPYVTKIEKVMSIPLIIDEEKSDDEASDMMNKHQVRYLAVSSNSKIEGIISMLDLIRPVYSGKTFWS